MKRREEIHQKVIELWQPYSAEPLAAADAEEILSSTSRFFRVLKRVHDKVQNGIPQQPAHNL